MTHDDLAALRPGDTVIGAFGTLDEYPVARVDRPRRGEVVAWLLNGRAEEPCHLWPNGSELRGAKR